jgi:type II secretory pathway component PulF
MNETTGGGAVARVRMFWRRALFGPSAGARIEIYEELAPALSAGIGVIEALDATAARNRGAKRRAVRVLADGVATDVALSATMRAHPVMFTPIEAALVETGERTGRLDSAFRAASKQLDRARATRNRVLQGCLYPLLLVHVFVVTTSVVRAGAGGSFLGTALPLLALIWGTLLVAASANAALADSRAYARVLGALPVVGTALRTGALARFARAFGALHGAGMTYDESLRIAAEASGSALLRSDAAVAAHALARGMPFSAALEQMPSVPSDVRGILTSGEHAGELESAAVRVAEFQEERGEVVTKRALALLPGCLVLIIGLAVAAWAFQVLGGIYR